RGVAADGRGGPPRARLCGRARDATGRGTGRRLGARGAPDRRGVSRPTSRALRTSRSGDPTDLRGGLSPPGRRPGGPPVRARTPVPAVADRAGGAPRLRSPPRGG